MQTQARAHPGTQNSELLLKRLGFTSPSAMRRKLALDLNWRDTPYRLSRRLWQQRRLPAGRGPCGR